MLCGNRDGGGGIDLNKYQRLQLEERGYIYFNLYTGDFKLTVSRIVLILEPLSIITAQ